MRARLRIKRFVPWRSNFPVDDRQLRQNLSFVTHDHSQSQYVSAIAANCRQHALTAFPRLDTRWGSQLPSDIDICLSTTIGYPVAFENLIAHHDPPPRVLYVDRLSTFSHDVTFFRAPASLSLPGSTRQRAAVAALVALPGRSSSRLWRAGPRSWPDESAAILGDLERLIQSFTDQWMPRAALWQHAAEYMLPDGEITSP